MLFDHDLTAHATDSRWLLGHVSSGSLAVFPFSYSSIQPEIHNYFQGLVLQEQDSQTGVDP